VRIGRVRAQPEQPSAAGLVARELGASDIIVKVIGYIVIGRHIGGQCFSDLNDGVNVAAVAESGWVTRQTNQSTIGRARKYNRTINKRQVYERLGAHYAMTAHVLHASSERVGTSEIHCSQSRF
jgi:hypothetical protein